MEALLFQRGSPRFSFWPSTEITAAGKAERRPNGHSRGAIACEIRSFAVDARLPAVYGLMPKQKVNEGAAMLTGFRLIVLICLFLSSALYVTARQTMSRQQEPLLASAATVEGVGQESARQVEPVAVDAVRQPGADMPLERHVDGPQDSASLVKRLNGDDVIAVAVSEENRRTRDDIGRKMLRAGDKPRKAHNARHRPRAAKARVKRHHGALAKAHKRKRIVRKAKGGKLIVQKRVKSRRRVVYAAPTLAGVAKRKVEPLPSGEWVAGARLWSVR